MVDEMAITLQQKTDKSASTISELQAKIRELEQEAEVWNMGANQKKKFFFVLKP